MARSLLVSRRSFLDGFWGVAAFSTAFGAALAGAALAPFLGASSVSSLDSSSIFYAGFLPFYGCAGCVFPLPFYGWASSVSSDSSSEDSFILLTLSYFLACNFVSTGFFLSSLVADLAPSTLILSPETLCAALAG